MLPKRILVVDDEPFVCDAVRMMLEFDGHEVTTAGAPRDALAFYRPGNFDLVFTDFSMPGMNGIEFTKAIRSIEPNQRVIVITAYAEVLPPTGADAVIPKPFLLDDLRQTMAKLLGEPARAQSAVV